MPTGYPRDWESEVREQLERDNATFIAFSLNGPHQVAKRTDHVCFECECEKIVTKNIRPLVYEGGGAFCKACVEKTRRARTEATNLRIRGVRFPMQSEEVKEKRMTNNTEKWGVPFSMQRGEVREKGKATNLQRYGVPYACQSEEVKDRIKATP